MAENESSTTAAPTVNPFAENVNEIVLPAAETKDVNIAEKDEKIEEEGRVNTKPNQPEAVPSATPKDIPARPEEDKKDIKPATEVENKDGLDGKETKPATSKEEIKFANDESKKIYENLLAGNEDAVFDYLSEKKTLKNLDKLEPAELIKLQIKKENPEYKPEDVEDLFSDKYSLPEKPEQRLEETSSEFEAREEKYKADLAKAERRLERGAIQAKKDLAKLHEELVLPDIAKPEPQATAPTKTKEELEKERADFVASVSEGVSDFKSIDFDYADVDKGIDIKASYKISDAEAAELKTELENFDLEKFVESRWLTKDGKVNTKQLAKDLFTLNKGEEITKQLIEKTATKAYAAAIKKQKNVDFSGTTRSGNLAPEAAEVEAQKAKHFFAN